MADRGRAVLAGLLCLLLSACAGVPTEGPVRPGRELPAVVEEPGIGFIAEPPNRGAQPQEIVRGFLQASADFTGDHQIARRYLTPQARQAWRPEVGVAVYDRQVDLELSSPATGSVRVRGAQVAAIDSEGAYGRTPPATPVERAFELERVDGQWRIAALANGLLLSSVDVDEVFRQVSLYFLSPSRNTLVPDPILVPQLPGLATQLMTRLLRGPTARLRGAVQSAFPQGTELDVASVALQNGTAHVQLNAAALRASEDTRQQMSAQIVWTLRQVGAELRAVRITVEGDDLVTSGVASAQPRTAWDTFDPDVLRRPTSVFAVRDGRVGRLLEGKFQPVSGDLGTGSPAVRSPAVSLDGGRIAAVTADGASLLVSRLKEGAVVHAVAAGSDLSQPSWDPLANLWFVDRASGELFVVPEGGTRPVVVSLSDELAGSLRGVAVSRDGARLAMLAERNGSVTVVVGALTGVDLLEADATSPGAVEVTATYEVLPALTGAPDVAWADATTLLTVGSVDGLPVPARFVSIDGYQVVDIGSQEQLVSLAVAPPLRPQDHPVYGATSGGRLFMFSSGVGWEPAGRGSDPTYPG